MVCMCWSDLTKQDRSNVIVLQNILTRLKQPRGNVKQAAGAADAARKAMSNAERHHDLRLRDCPAVAPLTHYG
jgi:hypothetical protein